MDTAHARVTQTAELRNSFDAMGSDPHSDRPDFRVTVVHTTTEGTITALRAAATLAAGLGAELALLATEEVPLQFPLDKLPIPVDLLERRLYDLVCDSGIRESEVLIQLLFCRDKYVCLRRFLRPRSLVVVGRSKHWRSRRNRQLEHFLSYLGHQVVLVVSPQTTHSWRDWDWETFLIRVFANLSARRIEV